MVQLQQLPSDDRAHGLHPAAIGTSDVGADLPCERPAKAEFLARMGHELRTPLNAIVGFTKLLRRETEGFLEERYRSKLEHIEDAGGHLLYLLNAMLDLSCVEADAVRFDLKAVALDELARHTVAMLESLARQREIRLTMSRPLEGVVQADPMRLRQVLINLLSNAIKYNRPQGEVRLEEQRDPSGITLFVCDDGCGMSVEQLDHLFEPFNRLGKEHSGIEGTGIGLALSKALVEHMGGRITVTSCPDQGSKFALWLPMAEQTRASCLGAAPSRTSRLPL